MTSGGIDLGQRFADAMGQLLGPDFPQDIGLAVSGGGDSMAMLTLAHNWTHVFGVRLWVVTVDHGLRAESAAEAALVAQECAALGHPHSTLRWHWDGTGNLQARARAARLRLIDAWRGGIRHVLFAHTADDVAENLLMRLERGAGVSGLSAMRARRVVACAYSAPLPVADIDGPLPEPGPGAAPRPFEVLRPCLTMRRGDLRHYLRTFKGRWAEDASNLDARFNRVRKRGLLELLENEGLGVDALAATAHRMARAQEALMARAVQVWTEIGSEPGLDTAPTGDLVFDRSGFEAVERDTQMRLLSLGLCYLSSQTYRPRENAICDLLDRTLGGGAGTLHGCEVRMERDRLRLLREFAAVRDKVQILNKDGVETRTPWDGRWIARPGVKAGLELRVLGDQGWAQARAHAHFDPACAPPYHVARGLPGIWDGDILQDCNLWTRPGQSPATTLTTALTTALATGLAKDGAERGSFKAFLLSH